MESNIERKDGSVKKSCHHGISMSEEELKDWQKSFSDIEESIKLIMKEGEDL